MEAKIEKVKKLYGEIPYKHEAIVEVATATKTKPMTVKSHWLCKSGFWSVPKAHIDTTIATLEKVKQKQLAKV